MAAPLPARAPPPAAARIRPGLATARGSTASPSRIDHYPAFPTISTALHHSALVAHRFGQHLQHAVAFVHMMLLTSMLLATGRLFSLPDHVSDPPAPSFRNERPRTPWSSPHACCILAALFGAMQHIARDAAMASLAQPGNSISSARGERAARENTHERLRSSGMRDSVHTQPSATPTDHSHILNYYTELLYRTTISYNYIV